MSDRLSSNATSAAASAPTRSSAALPSHYRAWRWHGSADPLALTLDEVALQPLAPGEVLVRNDAIGLNPVDWKVLGGGLTAWQPGHIPGVDGAGEVVAVGPDVAQDWLGQRVAYHTSLHGHGSFADYAPVPARALMRLPQGMTAERAAAFPCPALTAWQAIEKVPAQPGRTLLISGAGGAVGHYLIQLARSRGFDITAMANARHHERLRALGAHHCIAGPLADGQSWTGGRQFQVVIDTVSGSHAERLSASLQANGHLVCIQDRVPTWPNAAFGLTLSMHEVALGALHVHGDDLAWKQLTQAGEQMLAQVADGQMDIPDREVRDFSGLSQLLADLQHRRFSGKPVVQMR
ncbi:zinc-binding dehydrogenase [Roseateles depolymerans]|uniref:Alcohol dehydrogenase n=1 Tax=Roseateles depolymerans TaxID=76731 RepID=A0A0U3NAQ7_9BURK|nr:zinc-binding dehydrogenase [Roseateles depolymerans]ALV05616.1 alcohol dehydrogenase [Roseateles depolymerans]REG14365.1 NADPH:quinone reductase-like Zn-dependent oxidoreductase [Roseateles depolymerans]